MSSTGAGGRSADVPSAESRVLIVDDNVDAAEILADALGVLGYSTRVAFDGPGALSVVDEFTPDVALLDIGLPVMDGFELAARLRARPALATVPFVALTGYGQERDRARAVAAGFCEHLVKPIDLDHLASTLVRVLGARPQRAI